MADDMTRTPPGSPDTGGESISFDEFLPEEEAPLAFSPEEGYEENSKEKIEKWRERGKKTEERLRGKGKGAGETVEEPSLPTKGAARGGGRAIAKEGEQVAARGVAKGAGRAAVGAGGRAVASTAVRAGATAGAEAIAAGATEKAVAGSVVPGAGTAIGVAVGTAIGVADAASSLAFGFIKGQYKPVDLAEFIFILLICLTVDAFSLLSYFILVGVILAPIIKMLCLAVLGGWFLLFKGSTKPLGIMRALIKFIIVTIGPFIVFPFGLFIPSLALIFTVETLLHNKVMGSLIKTSTGTETQKT
jgi:hypothetical protein